MPSNSITTLRKEAPLDFGCDHLNHLAGQYWLQGKAIADAFEAGQPEPVFVLHPLPPCFAQEVQSMLYSKG